MMNLVRLVLLSLSMVAICLGQELFPVRDEGESRNRSFDVLHYRIEVALDERTKSVRGTVTTTLVPFLPHLSTVTFDAENMTIHKVMDGKGKELAFEVLPKSVMISLDRSYSYRDTLRLSIVYSCTPTKGLYFVAPDSGYPDKPWQIWSQGEDMDNHFWFPCYDFPNDVATSEMIATVNRKFSVLSNGKLVGVSEDRKGGTKTFHWRMSKPHVSYLIMIAVGEYAILRDTAGTTPLEYWVYPSHLDDARVSFAQTPDIMRFFNQRIGFAYPWEKYAQVLCHDFVVGGMENTSATSLIDNGAVFDPRARVDHSAVSLIAHEMSHQWWGDVVTCKDWRHLWLNESFASYFDELYHESYVGRDEFDYQVYNSQQAGIDCDKTNGRKPIVSVGSYGTNLYPRGASVLHMLRYVLGDSLYWRSLRYYITKHQFTPVETNDLKRAVEEVTGQNLHWFFDEWVYKAGYPTFKVSSTWNDTLRSLALRVTQVQPMDSLTGVFRMPVDVEIRSGVQRQTVRLEILHADTTFTIPCPSSPTLVLFDPGNMILKEVQFKRSNEEMALQAAEAGNPVLRIMALKEIAAADSNNTFLPVVAQAMCSDPFWGVRLQAIAAARRMTLQSAVDSALVRRSLVQASRDPKAAVRTAAVYELGAFRGEEVLAVLQQALKDSSYNVEAVALRSLSMADSAGVVALLSGYLDASSLDDIVASSALRSLARVDSGRAVTEAIRKAAYGQPTNMRWAAFEILTRYGNGRTDVEPVLLSAVKEKNRWLRWTAIQGLGSVGGHASLPVLDAIADNPDDAGAEAAKKSAERIRKRIEAESLEERTP